MSADRKGRLKHIVCCIDRDETRKVGLKERKEFEGLQLAYLVPLPVEPVCLQGMSAGVGGGMMI